MAKSVTPRTLRAFFLACGLAWFGPAAAGTLLSPGAAILIKKSAEPFGLPTAMLLDGGLLDKWLGVQRRLDDEMVQLALCEGDREGCASPAALQFLAIVDVARAREGRARLGERLVHFLPPPDLRTRGERRERPDHRGRRHRGARHGCA